MRVLPLRRPGQPEPASEAAARWVLRQEEGAMSAAEERSFGEWLASDPSHVAAYEDALWALDAVARHAGEPDMLALRATALAAGGGRGVFWNWGAALGLAAASVAAIVIWMPRSGEPPSVGKAATVAEKTADPDGLVYRTAIGERSAIALTDGSIATLDTDSQIRVAYTPAERGVYLVKGQALFEVAHGRRAPFQVYAGGQRITAVGTTFNVRIEGKAVHVAMVEGSVRVRAIAMAAKGPASPAREIALRADEALVAEPGKPLLVRTVDTTPIVSWRGGVLTFNDTRLSDAVAEVNRYTTRPIAIADGAVGNYRISGVFRSNDPEHFSQAVAQVLPVAVTHAPDGAPTLRIRDQ